MQIVTTGRVVDGKIVVDDERLGDVSLTEGSLVKVTLDFDGDGGPELTPEMEAELDQVAARLDRGEYVTWEEARARLRRFQREMGRR